MAFNTAYNACPRVMENGDWSVPFSACFVMKNISDFICKRSEDKKEAAG